MRDDQAFEALLIRALDRKGARAPFSVDVSDLVMARVTALGAVPRREMSLRQFGRWATAASIAGASLATAVVWQARSLVSAFSGFLHTMADATAAALKLTQPAGAVVETIGRAAQALVSSAQTLVQPLAPFQPFARVLLVAVALAMLSITTYVVGRDLRARVADKERA